MRIEFEAFQSKMANLCNKKTFTKEFTKSDVTKKIVERGEMAFFIVYHQ